MTGTTCEDICAIPNCPTYNLFQHIQVVYISRNSWKLNKYVELMKAKVSEGLDNMLPYGLYDHLY